MSKLSFLASVSQTRSVLEQHGLMTKKALGQHFLINDGIVQRICDLAELTQEDKVIEVGPGIGTLSVALLQSNATLIYLRYWRKPASHGKIHLLLLVAMP